MPVLLSCRSGRRRQRRRADPGISGSWWDPPRAISRDGLSKTGDDSGLGFALAREAPRPRRDLQGRERSTVSRWRGPIGWRRYHGEHVREAGGHSRGPLPFHGFEARLQRRLEKCRRCGGGIIVAFVLILALVFIR